jgi:hypothetical protein
MSRVVCMPVSGSSYGRNQSRCLLTGVSAKRAAERAMAGARAHQLER